MAKQQAIRPEVFNLQSFIETKEDNKGATDEEKILAAGADQAFWHTLKKHIENTIAELDEINSQAIAVGSSFDEIGKNTVVINLTKGVIRKIFNKVDDAIEAVENSHGEQRE